MRLVARPRSLFTFEFDVFDESGSVLASFRHRAFRTTGTLTAGGRDHQIRRAGAGLIVADDGRTPVKIEAEGRGRLRISWRGGSLEIVRAGLGFRLDLIDGGEIVGSLGLRNLFGRTMTLEAQREVPPLVAAALFYLAVARRRQLLMVGGS